MSEAHADRLLVVDRLVKTFPVPRGLAQSARRQPERRIVAVDGVSFELARREVLGLVGESGSGKTTIARCLVRLYDPDSGAASFDGEDIIAAAGDVLRRLRRRMQLIYQDPYSSLNPVMRVGNAISEPARVHGVVSGRRAERELVDELLRSVGLRPVDAQRYPRELSGGQRQRVAIARALAAGPELLIADEAVSALDVSVQAQILNLFADLAEGRHLAMIFVSHQLAVIAQLSQRVAIMYLGRIVEIGATRDVFRSPQHPYTSLLLEAHPSLEAGARRRGSVWRGDAPATIDFGAGCRFRNRCPVAMALCAEVDPPAKDLGNGHLSWCHLASDRPSVAPAGPVGPAGSQAEASTGSRDVGRADMGADPQS